MDGPKPGLRKEEGRAWGQHPNLVKKLRYRNMHNKWKQYFRPGKGRAWLTRAYDVLRWKPKGSRNANDLSFDQDNFEHRHWERANNVRNGENCSGCNRNAEI